MKRRATALLLTLACAHPVPAQNSENDQLEKSAEVMAEILAGDKGLPTNILAKAECVLIFPGVKKVATGNSYGHGELVCRKGKMMSGSWSAPAMYKLDQGSLGIQLRSTDTDFVLVIMNRKGAEEALKGKLRLGANAAAAAGPSGTHGTSYDANTMKLDVLTYSRSQGVFCGVALYGASMNDDKDSNKALYGKDHSPKQIVTAGTAPAAANALITVLDKASPARS